MLLRVHRRFYDGDKAYIKNLVQCDTSDPLPDHFVRLAILYWLEKYQNEEGPAGVRGFHAASKIVNDLVQLGHDANRVRAELLYLVKGGCVIPEHLQSDKVDHDDLVMLTASGLVHLQLMANPDYLAACAEDTHLSDQDLVKRVVARIVSRDTVGHFSRLTTARNASEFVEYLKAKAAERIGSSRGLPGELVRCGAEDAARCRGGGRRYGDRRVDSAIRWESSLLVQRTTLKGCFQGIRGGTDQRGDTGASREEPRVRIR